MSREENQSLCIESMSDVCEWRVTMTTSTRRIIQMFVSDADSSRRLETETDENMNVPHTRSSVLQHAAAV